MKKMAIYDFCIAFLACMVFATLQSCSVFTPKNARTALDSIQLACIMQSMLVDISELQKACDVSDDLTPVLRELVSTRDAARQNGVTWNGAKDGGTDGGR